MPFDPDTKESLNAAAWLINTEGDPDQLQSIADLGQFLAEYKYTGRIDRDQEELEAVRNCRQRLRQLLTASRDEAPTLINEVLRHNNALPQLVRHSSRDWWHIHAVEPEAYLPNRILVEAAMAMSVVVIRDELSRIHTCADGSCSNVVVDSTRNRSRRFCSPTCSNRTTVAAFRARQRA